MGTTHAGGFGGDLPSRTAVPVSARVHWFDPIKGFGFVHPDDGAGPAFLHISLLNRAGLHAIAAGTPMLCRLAPGPRGRQVIDIISVGSAETAATAETTLAGTVKWFKEDKGYGFVLGDDDGVDIFVHATVVRRCGFVGLATGQRLTVKVRVTPQGREAVWVGSPQ